MNDPNILKLILDCNDLHELEYIEQNMDKNTIMKIFTYHYVIPTIHIIKSKMGLLLDSRSKRASAQCGSEGPEGECTLNGGIRKFKAECIYLCDVQMLTYNWLEYIKDCEYLKIFKCAVPSLLSSNNISKSLITLNISHCNVKYVELLNLHNIKYIYLNCNNVRNVYMYNLNKLKSLDLCDNSIECIQLVKCQSLKYLNLSKNNIAFDEFNIPNSVTHLNISHNNLESHCRDLLHQDVSNNNLKSHCRNLLHLDVSNNNLSNLNILFHFTIAKLKYLNISNNNLTNIEIVGSLKYLNNIDVSYNSIIELPTFDSNKMKYINISNNQLHCINNVLSLFCKYIDASNNNINKCIVIRVNLHQHINISHNAISNIKFIGGNDYLMNNLNVSHNDLNNSHFLLPLNKLQVLNISHNNISSINHHFKNLLKLNASHNLLNRFYIRNFISSVDISYNDGVICENRIYDRCNFLDLTNNDMKIDICTACHNYIIDMKCCGNTIINEHIIKYLKYLKNYTSDTLQFINYYIDDSTELHYELEFFDKLYYDMVKSKTAYNVYINEENDLDTIIIKDQKSIDLENKYNDIFKYDRLIRLYHY